VVKRLSWSVISVVMIACGLWSCTGLRPGREPTPSTVDGMTIPQPRAGHFIYRVDSEHSELRILVYRAGPLAKLGHNHVLINRLLTGWIDMSGKPGSSSFALVIPSRRFIVDESSSRREEGGDFDSLVDDDAKAGTLRNMQSAALLDAGRFESITVRSISINGTEPNLTAGLVINVAGHESKVNAPFVVEQMAGKLSATGTLKLRQSALGLAPFSVMMGALQVQDEITVKFRLAAGN